MSNMEKETVWPGPDNVGNLPEESAEDYREFI